MTMSAFDIDTLVEELVPVKPLRRADAALAVAGMTTLSVAFVAIAFGLRDDVLAGSPEPVVILRAGMLLLLGFAAFLSITAAARPHVGQTNSGWKWALAAALLFPATSLITALLQGRYPVETLYASSGPWCLGISGLSGFAIGGVLTLWLKRGAPTSLNQAGGLVGLCAGSFGAFAYSLHCPSMTVHYIGLWYTLAVALCVLLGRLIVPPIIRW
jgi:hypothetical protein